MCLYVDCQPLLSSTVLLCAPVFSILFYWTYFILQVICHLILKINFCWGGSFFRISLTKFCTSLHSMFSTGPVPYMSTCFCIFDSICISFALRIKTLIAWFRASLKIYPPKFSTWHKWEWSFQSFKKTSSTRSCASLED